MILRHASLYTRLLLGFAAVALLTLLLGAFASWQFARVAAATDDSLRATVADIEARDSVDALAARRGDLLARLQAVATAAAIRELTAGAEWTELVARSGLAPDLRQAIERLAAERGEFFARQEELARRLGEARVFEQALRDRLLPAEHKLAADEAELIRRVNDEVENVRNDTISNLFLNFDSTMDQVSLMLEIQARLFRLRTAETGPVPATELRAEIIGLLEKQEDEAARRLVAKLRDRKSVV